ncbi:hypothetical protein Pla123a_32350 [Posidoniimonas polymericola]|uniref:Uncharacterized protein n=1 Tax=Posidoniimonas polymericola TaxID=2528002 RepID=A0A5C5YLC8_9BACT|nr:hypothetical protein Pla123a_32350 [Posidoniimonas polymericola]
MQSNRQGEEGATVRFEANERAGIGRSCRVQVTR